MIVFIISEMHRKAQILPTRVFIAPVWSELFGVLLRPFGLLCENAVRRHSLHNDYRSFEHNKTHQSSFTNHAHLSSYDKDEVWSSEILNSSVIAHAYCTPCAEVLYRGETLKVGHLVLTWNLCSNV